MMIIISSIDVRLKVDEMCDSDVVDASTYVMHIEMYVKKMWS